MAAEDRGYYMCQVAKRQLRSFSKLLVVGEHGPHDLDDRALGRGGAADHHRRGEQPQHGVRQGETQRQPHLQEPRGFDSLLISLFL